MFCFLLAALVGVFVLWICKNKLMDAYTSYIREFWPNSANGVGSSKPPSFFEWLKYKVTGK